MCAGGGGGAVVVVWCGCGVIVADQPDMLGDKAGSAASCACVLSECYPLHVAALVLAAVCLLAGQLRQAAACQQLYIEC